MEEREKEGERGEKGKKREKKKKKGTREGLRFLFIRGKLTVWPATSDKILINPESLLVWVPTRTWAGSSREQFPSWAGRGMKRAPFLLWLVVQSTEQPANGDRRKRSRKKKRLSSWESAWYEPGTRDIPMSLSVPLYFLHLPLAEIHAYSFFSSEEDIISNILYYFKS